MQKKCWGWSPHNGISVRGEERGGAALGVESSNSLGPVRTQWESNPQGREQVSPQPRTRISGFQPPALQEINVSVV